MLAAEKHLWAVAVVLASCAPSNRAAPRPLPETTGSTSDVDELVALANLYGVIRYFHPTDAGATVDWPAFLVESVEPTIAGTDAQSLATALSTRFEPLMSGVRLGPAEAEIESPASGPHEVVWQHLGYGATSMPGVYRSKRTGRTTEEAPPGASVATIAQKLDATPLRGRRVRFEAMVSVRRRALDDRVVVTAFAPGNAATEPAKALTYARGWTKVTVETEVPTDAAALYVGMTVHGTGRFGFDDCALSVLSDTNTWTSHPLADASFDEADPTRSWSQMRGDYEVRRVDERGSSLLVERRRIEIVDDPFVERPRPGETWRVDLGSGLWAAGPLGLSAAEAASCCNAPPADEERDLLDEDDTEVRVAAVIEAWTVWRHFHPYADVLALDWDAMLRRGLTEALQSADEIPLEFVLRHLGHELDDAHFTSQHPSAELGWVQARLVRDGARVVVVAASPSSGLRPGDEIVSVDASAVDRAMEDQARLVSGADHYVQHLLLAEGMLTRGREGSRARLGVVRDDRSIEVTATRQRARAPSPFSHPSMHRYPDGVWFIDLRKVSWAELQAALPELARAPGAVFDLRGTPNANHELLRHLLSRGDDAKWMFVPKIVRPGPEPPIGWEVSGWELAPASPHLDGSFAFLVDATTMSYAESVVGIIEHYDLGVLVGQPTAGANGNIATFVVPGGAQLMFTGMRVTKLDGTRHFGLGFRPDEPVTPTLRGLLAGRDEMLERALHVVRNDIEHRQSGPSRHRTR